MPRRHPRPQERKSGGGPVGDGAQVEAHGDGSWHVRRLTGITVVKAYRCPGCQQEIAIGTPHVVAWPVDSDGEERRHWHTGCWAARERRHPPGPRSARPAR